MTSPDIITLVSTMQRLVHALERLEAVLAGRPADQSVPLGEAIATVCEAKRAAGRRAGGGVAG